ncbi:MAG: DUF4157 domain-containing protein [Bacteroidota bacterium]
MKDYVPRIMRDANDSEVTLAELNTSTSSTELAQERNDIVLRYIEGHPVYRSLLDSAPGPVQVQAKLQLSQPDSPLEKEADEAASQAVQQGSAHNIVQRQTSGEDGSVGALSDDFTRRLQERSGTGSPLDRSFRAEMESAMGADFSEVSIHTGIAAAELAREINAKAFTYGSDIFFGENEFNLITNSGKELMAHELVHVVQQQSQVGRKVQRSGKTRDPNATLRFVISYTNYRDLPGGAELRQEQERQLNQQIFGLSDEDVQHLTPIVFADPQFQGYTTAGTRGLKVLASVYFNGLEQVRRYHREKQARPQFAELEDATWVALEIGRTYAEESPDALDGDLAHDYVKNQIGPIYKVLASYPDAYLQKIPAEYGQGSRNWSEDWLQIKKYLLQMHNHSPDIEGLRLRPSEQISPSNREWEYKLEWFYPRVEAVNRLTTFAIGRNVTQLDKPMHSFGKNFLLDAVEGLKRPEIAGQHKIVRLSLNEQERKGQSENIYSKVVVVGKKEAYDVQHAEISPDNPPLVRKWTVIHDASLSETSHLITQSDATALEITWKHPGRHRIFCLVDIATDGEYQEHLLQAEVMVYPDVRELADSQVEQDLEMIRGRTLKDDILLYEQIGLSSRQELYPKAFPHFPLQKMNAMYVAQDHYMSLRGQQDPDPDELLDAAVEMLWAYNQLENHFVVHAASVFNDQTEQYRLKAPQYVKNIEDKYNFNGWHFYKNENLQPNPNGYLPKWKGATYPLLEYALDASNVRSEYQQKRLLEYPVVFLEAFLPQMDEAVAKKLSEDKKKKGQMNQAQNHLYQGKLGTGTAALLLENKNAIKIPAIYYPQVNEAQESYSTYAPRGSELEQLTVRGVPVFFFLYQDDTNSDWVLKDITPGCEGENRIRGEKDEKMLTDATRLRALFGELESADERYADGLIYYEIPYENSELTGLHSVRIVEGMELHDWLIGAAVAVGVAAFLLGTAGAGTPVVMGLAAGSALFSIAGSAAYMHEMNKHGLLTTGDALLNILSIAADIATLGAFSAGMILVKQGANLTRMGRLANKSYIYLKGASAAFMGATMLVGSAQIIDMLIQQGGEVDNFTLARTIGILIAMGTLGVVSVRADIADVNHFMKTGKPLHFQNPMDPQVNSGLRGSLLEPDVPFYINREGIISSLPDTKEMRKQLVTHLDKNAIRGLDDVEVRQLYMLDEASLSTIGKYSYSTDDLKRISRLMQEDADLVAQALKRPRLARNPEKLEKEFQKAIKMNRRPLFERHIRSRIRTHDGRHTIKVLEDGQIMICTQCKELEQYMKSVLGRLESADIIPQKTINRFQNIINETKNLVGTQQLDVVQNLYNALGPMERLGGLLDNFAATKNADFLVEAMAKLKKQADSLLSGTRTIENLNTNIPRYRMFEEAVDMFYVSHRIQGRNLPAADQARLEQMWKEFVAQGTISNVADQQSWIIGKWISSLGDLGLLQESTFNILLKYIQQNIGNPGETIRIAISIEQISKNLGSYAGLELFYNGLLRELPKAQDPLLFANNLNKIFNTNSQSGRLMVEALEIQAFDYLEDGSRIAAMVNLATKAADENSELSYLYISALYDEGVSQTVNTLQLNRIANEIEARIATHKAATPGIVNQPPKVSFVYPKDKDIAQGARAGKYMINQDSIDLVVYVSYEFRGTTLRKPVIFSFDQGTWKTKMNKHFEKINPGAGNKQLDSSNTYFADIGMTFAEEGQFYKELFEKFLRHPKLNNTKIITSGKKSHIDLPIEMQRKGNVFTTPYRLGYLADGTSTAFPKLGEVEVMKVQTLYPREANGNIIKKAQ